MRGCDTINNNHTARKVLANNIVYYRLKLGWSQEDFADKLGTTPAYVSSLENAKRKSSIDYIEHIANTLGVEITQLFEKRKQIENRRLPRRKKNM